MKTKTVKNSLSLVIILIINLLLFAALAKGNTVRAGCNWAQWHCTQPLYRWSGGRWVCNGCNDNIRLSTGNCTSAGTYSACINMNPSCACNCIINWAGCDWTWPCTPNCSGKNCGPDGCGGICGTCVAPQFCNASGRCENPGASCLCDSWANGACGAGLCGSNERQQTRACVPAACDAETQCVVDPTCTLPSCTVDLLPATSTTSVGSSVTLTASVTIGSGSVSSVGFTSSNTAVATVNPASDTTPTYSTSVSALSAGSSTITADVYMGAGIVCSDTAAQTVTVIADPWWQVQDSDVSTNGDLVSEIPATCILPGCNPVFNLKGTGTFPGVTLYGGGNADFAAGSGQGKAAEDPNNWLVASSYQGKTYDYAYFARQIPSDVSLTEVTDTTVNGGFFQSGGAPSRGYVWYHYNGNILGDLTMQGNLNLNGTRKVVLLVEGADFYLDSRINIQRTGEGFFMVVVGKNANGLKGNIFVDPSVSGSPSIEGIFLAEGTFHTGAGTNQLHVLGSVVGYDGIALERDLGQPANNTAPAEFFEYSPELMSVFPQVFTSRRMRWKEVAP